MDFNDRMLAEAKARGSLASGEWKRPVKKREELAKSALSELVQELRRIEVELHILGDEILRRG